MRLHSLMLAWLLCGLPLFARTLETHQSAEVVLGQADFSSNAAFASATGLAVPGSIAIDPTTGKIFVGHGDGILRYASATTLKSGAAAEAVLGADSPDTPVTGTGPDRFGGGVVGLCFDSAGRLWATDHVNHRVLRFDNASSKASGADADGVLGQMNFNTNAAAVSATAMDSPYSVSVDPSGTLWVADSGNNRVLGFKNAAFLPWGAAASIVIGQTGFGTKTTGVTQSTLNSPLGVFADSDGDLWVSDSDNFRILRFASVTGYASNTMGPNATAVIGQSNFTSKVSGQSASLLRFMYEVVLDAKGNLYVPEIFNRRVLVFANAKSILTGGTASVVLGQPDFTTTTLVAPPTEKSLDSPSGIALDADSNLWVADSGNNRVLRYRTIFPKVQLKATPKTSSIAPGAEQRLRFLAKNTSTVPGDFRFLSKVNPGAFEVRFKLGAKNVTAGVKAGTLTKRILSKRTAALIANVTAGASGRLRLPVKVTPVADEKAAKRTSATITVETP